MSANDHVILNFTEMSCRPIHDVA